MPRKRNGFVVKDKEGNRFTVVTRERVETDLGAPRTVVWFELETGERVTLVDAKTFLLPRTGKKLHRVRRSRQHP